MNVQKYHPEALRFLAPSEKRRGVVLNLEIKFSAKKWQEMKC